jgi:hypothetical protein
VIADADDFGADFKAAVAAQAAAARRTYKAFSDPETREPACLTLDAVNAAGGVDETPEQKVRAFAEQQFTVKGKAKAFAGDLKKMSNLELAVIPSLWCTAHDVRDPE